MFCSVVGKVPSVNGISDGPGLQPYCYLALTRVTIVVTSPASYLGAFIYSIYLEIRSRACYTVQSKAELK